MLIIFKLIDLFCGHIFWLSIEFCSLDCFVRHCNLIGNFTHELDTLNLFH